VQALERTQPVLPLGLGYVEGVGSVRNFVCERLVVNGYCIAQQSPIATA
jgi:hypothetical protein